MNKIYKDTSTCYISFRGLHVEYMQQCEKNNNRGNHIICASKTVHLGNCLVGVVNKLVTYCQFLIDQFNIIIRIRKDKYCRYNEYPIKIPSELLQYTHVRYGKIMNYALFEEPNDENGMKHFLLTWRKSLGVKEKIELFVGKSYPNININDFDEARSKEQDLKGINI